MVMTNNQYLAISQLQEWWRKFNHQIIDIDAHVGTGIHQTLQFFIQLIQMDPREVAYLSLNQKQVLDLAYKKYHAYYLYGFLYKYTKTTKLDSLPILNPYTTKIDSQWKKSIRKIDKRYKLLIVYDSSLLKYETIRDLSSLGLPMILLRDSYLLPSPETFTFLREPNIELTELHPDLSRNPLVYFANKIRQKIQFKEGNYDNINILSKKRMNLYNLRSADMILTLNDEGRREINSIYRERILKRKTPINILQEKLIVKEDMYSHKLVNKDEKKIKIYLRKGLVGYLTKINKHALYTRYVPIEFKPEFYHESFTNLTLDRKELNQIENTSRQILYDNIMKTEYAYALTPDLSRTSYWDKVILILDDAYDEELMKMLLYTSITRAKRQLNIII